MKKNPLFVSLKKGGLLLFLFTGLSFPLLLAGGSPKLPGNGKEAEKTFSDPGAVPIQRRAAFRLLLKKRKGDEKFLLKGLNDPDSVIRKRCIFELYSRNKAKALPQLLAKAGDRDWQVASMLLLFGKDLKEKNSSSRLLEELARKSPFETIRRKADLLANFNFFRVNHRLKDSKTHDFELTSIPLMTLPLTGWKFRADAFSNGHKKGFYKPDFNDRKWRDFKIGCWEEQGYNGYDGIAWYRLRFKAPRKPDCKAVELAFGAVDESAWVWLNGIYIGQHDMGVSGWNKPFWLDVTKELRWGEENVLVVRVQDTLHGGGIWKSIGLEIVK